MLAGLIVLGVTLLVVSRISRMLPEGGKFSVLAGVASVIASLVIGLGIGALLAWLDASGDPAQPYNYLMTAVITGMICAALSPFAVRHYRRSISG